jgi:hypothetical protein
MKGSLVNALAIIPVTNSSNTHAANSPKGKDKTNHEKKVQRIRYLISFAVFFGRGIHLPAG